MTRDGSSDPATDLDGPEPPRGRPSEVLRLASAPRIPGYRIDGLIGRGTTGTVYRAVQLAVERDVALKVLHPELAQRPQVVQRLQREARTMARLAHPHVVGAIDMGQVDGRWWFAMELVDGPSLAQYLRTHGPLSEREALRLFAPLCEALEHLAEHGVVHRDVKPANILLERAGRGEAQHLRARLADLGLAVGERDPSLTVHGGTLGTPHYISPEQSRDPRDVDVRSDLWALGATLFHAVCGRPPFEGDSAAEVLSAVLHQPVPDPRRIAPRISPGLALVVRKCLVRDPARRYQSPAELLADIERLRERRTPLVQRRDLDPLERDPRPWRRPVPWLVVGLVAAAALAVHLALRPAGVPDATTRADGAAEAVLAPLRERVESAEGEPRLWLAVLAEIDAARDAASGVGGGEAWLELRRRANAGLESELTQLRGGLTTRVDQALAQRDLVAARAELVRFDTALVARLGVDAAALPLDLALATQRRFDALSARVDAQLEERLADGARRIQEHEAAVVAPRVEALIEQERWRDARAILVAAPDRILAEAGLDVRGLPREAQDELVAGVLEGRTVRRSELDRAWVLRQRGLGERLELEADALGRFEWPAVPPDPASALPAALEAELARLGLVRAQAPDGAVLAVDLALPELVARTRARLSAALERSARDEFELRRSVVGASLAARRRFGELADQWGEFARRCDAVPAALSPGGFASELAAEARMLEHEGRRLERTLAAAADAVVALAGREANFEVAPRLSVTGTVTTSADPLANGFSVVVRERPYVLVLRPERSSRRCVVLDDIVELAGLGGELTPDQRLDLVCLRWHAGDRDGARRAVLDGPLPTDGLAARLSERMPARLLGAAPTGAAPGDVAELLALVLGPLAQRDPHLGAGIADVLLEQHVDDERVALAAERLRAVRGR